MTKKKPSLTDGLSSYFVNTWVLNNPHVVYRSIRGFLRAFLLRKNTLKTIELFPSMSCNLNCAMCSVEKYKVSSRSEGMTIADYKAIAHQGAKLGAITVNILGGEPLMCPELDDIVKIFKEEHYFVYMVSNGLLVERQRMGELKKMGLSGICFSLDSMEEENDDQVRGQEGHFKKVFEAIRIARETGLIVSLAPVFFPGQMENAVSVIRYCQKNGIGASGGLVAPVGAWEGGELLNEDERAEVRRLLKEFPRFTLDWAMSYYFRPRCPAGKEKIAVHANGDVVGCSLNPISFGNALEEPLADILERMGRFFHYNKDFPGCIAAEDETYIDSCIRPLYEFPRYPVNYKDHPNIGPDMFQE